jgi:hypothetical protein
MNCRCAAGVVYDDIDRGNRLPMRVGLPCFKPDEATRAALDGRQGTCAKVQFPTEDQIQAEIDERERHTERLRIATAAVAPLRQQHKGSDWEGVIECPICKGRLHVRHAGYNGHIHARCEAGCVAWME